MESELFETKWLKFERACIPPNASPVQRQEMRRSFYAGAMALLGMMLKIDENMTDEEGHAYIESIRVELREFLNGIGTRY